MFALVSGAAWAAPPAERLPADATVPSVGIPLTPTWNSSTPWPSRCLEDTVVIAGPASGDGRVLYAWVRDAGTGDWSWSGLLPIAGTAPVGTPMTAPWGVFSNRTDAIATTHLKEGVTVIRKINGVWTYRGLIPMQYTTSSGRNVEITGDTAMTNTSTSLKFWRYNEGTGTWAQTHEVAIDLNALGGGAPTQFRVANGSAGDHAILPWYLPLEFWGTSGRAAIHLYSLADPSAPVEVQVIVQDEELPWSLGAGMALGEDWLAVRSVQRTDPFQVGRIGFYRRNSQGQFERTQFAPKESVAYPMGFSGDRFIGGPAIWALNAKQEWVRGAELTPNPQWFSGDGYVAVTSDYKLAVWDDPSDCDGDGEVDAFAIASGKVPDCNRNGRPDSCDIASGVLADVNGNGTPDACETDCDANGVPDLTQIRDGAPASCDDPTVLASCAIANGAADVNSDGVVDACGPDLDGNGVPDVTQIANGRVTDCGGDWIPDEFPTYVPTSTAWNSAWVWGTAPANSSLMVAMGFDTNPSLRSITRVTMAVGIGDPAHVWTPIGRQFKVHIFSDPNGDRLVDDGALLWTGTGIYDNTELQSIDVPGVAVGGPAFIVAFEPPQGAWIDSLTSPPGSYPGMFQAKGYFFSSSLIHIPGQLGGSFAFVSGSTLPEDPKVALMLGGVYGLDPILSVFTDGCPIEGDINDDGIVNGADLGILLGDWGIGPSLADLDGNGIVDGADLGVLLGEWTG